MLRLCDVLVVVAGEKRLLLLPPREDEEDERRADQDRDQAGRVGPLVAVEEGLFRRGRDLAGVLRVLLSDGFGTGERLRELVLNAVGDMVGRGGDRRGRGRV